MKGDNKICFGGRGRGGGKERDGTDREGRVCEGKEGMAHSIWVDRRGKKNEG